LKTIALDKYTLMVVGLFGAALVATFAAYLPGLGGPLILDDLPQLSSLIAQSAEDPEMLFGNYVISTSGPLGRPVSMATFIGDAVTHGPDTWWWKYNSLMLHLINGLLLFWFIALLTRASQSINSVNPWLVSLVVSSVWLLHPLNVSTVLYTVQRMTLLSTTFVFAGMLCYVAGRLRQQQLRSSGWVLIAVAFFGCVPLAAFSKESGLLLVLFIMLVEFFVLGFRGPDSVARKIKLLHGTLLGIFVVGVLVLLANLDFVLDGYSFREFSPFERILTQFRVLCVYLSQLLLPLPGKLGFFHDDFSASSGLFEPFSTVLSVLLVLGLIVGAFWARKRMPLTAFGILYFFASHAMESTIVGLELMFEHRNYTGSFGIFLALVPLVAVPSTGRRALAVGSLLVVLGFGLLTWQRANIWSTPLSMYQHMYAVHPNSPRLNIMLANVYAAAGEYDNARVALAKLGPDVGRALHLQYLDCLETGELRDSAMDALSELSAGVVDEHTTSTIDSLVAATKERRCKVNQDRLLSVIDRVLTLRIRSTHDRREILYAKADLLDSMNRVGDAVDSYLEAQVLSHEHAVPIYRAADVLARRGLLDHAREMLQRAVEIEQQSRIVRKDLAETIYFGIAELYAAQGKADDALEVYAEASHSMPRNPAVPLAAAELLVSVQREEEAGKALAKARDLVEPGNNDLDFRMGRVADALVGIRPASSLK
jgi:tetratricopeptide (TPR) repeat protein